MNVSSVSSTSSNSYTSGNDSDVKQLLNRIKQLESQIETETQSKDDDKTKQEKIQLLRVQIT
ncbi:FlxA-like family protein [Desulfosporosinus nitroreducens]|uniref:FlxA-like family protein n=2 Tax=Desulfosporosinus nitroreducens TaxID=2018668 RepID=A0ABT8QVX4_9FIRM|nr:FlxA-like family protein [Desulfosporosinus nitroreducens]MDO0825507.1 FlxA-like family protein [Desulfosporosinus nitroreducens]